MKIIHQIVYLYYIFIKHDLIQKNIHKLALRIKIVKSAES